MRTKAILRADLTSQDPAVLVGVSLKARCLRLGLGDRGSNWRHSVMPSRRACGHTYRAGGFCRRIDQDRTLKPSLDALGNVPDLAAWCVGWIGGPGRRRDRKSCPRPTRIRKPPKRLLPKHAEKQMRPPRVMITDKLASYGADQRDSCRHLSSPAQKG